MHSARHMHIWLGGCLLILLWMAPAYAQPYANIQVNVYANNPEETAIGINPTNPANVVGAAQVPCRYYASSDGGSHWAEGQLHDPNNLGDPSVVFDRDGNVYYCYIGRFSHSGIFINKSTDGGYSWMPEGTAVIEHQGSIPFEDKPYPVCDWTDGPHRGNVCVAWTQFDEYGSPDPADSTRILFSRSTDGAASFSEPVRVSDQGGNALDSDDTVEGVVPAVGPDGTVYMAWSGPRGIEFDRSIDGGVTFGADRVITDQPGGWDFSVPGISRCNGFPVTKADFSLGRFRGRVYVCWSDQRNGDTDVFLIHTDDGGVTWSPRLRVNDDPIANGRDQFFPWMDVDPIYGTVSIVFYDRREHEDNLTTDVYLAVSEDGGEHFSNLKISAEPFIPIASVFFGDYIGISAFAGRVRPLWTRMDGSATSIWTALIDPDPARVSIDLPQEPRWRVSPNPARGGARILCSGLLSALPQLAIRDAQGRIVRQLEGPALTPQKDLWISWDGRDAAGRKVPGGIYFVGNDRRAGARILVLR